MKLQNFAIDYDGTVIKARRSTYDRMEAAEQLDEWLRWTQSGIDPDDVIDFCDDQDAQDPVTDSGVREKLIMIMRRGGYVRPSFENSGDERVGFYGQDDAYGDME